MGSIDWELKIKSKEGESGINTVEELGEPIWIARVSRSLTMSPHSLLGGKQALPPLRRHDYHSLFPLWSVGTRTFVKESGCLSLPTAHNPPHPRTIHRSYPDQSSSWKGLFRPASSPVCQDTSVFVGYIRHWPISWINHSINSPENLLIMKLRLGEGWM